MVVGNAFGLLTAVCQVLRRPTYLAHDKAEIVTLACVYFIITCIGTNLPEEFILPEEHLVNKC
jgi:hypothetical protein